MTQNEWKIFFFFKNDMLIERILNSMMLINKLNCGGITPNDICIIVFFSPKSFYLAAVGLSKIMRQQQQQHTHMCK